MTTIKDDFNNTPRATASGKYVITSTTSRNVSTYISYTTLNTRYGHEMELDNFVGTDPDKCLSPPL